MPKLKFPPRLKCECEYMRSFSPFDRAESGLEISARLKLLSCNRKRLFKKIHSGSRAAARLTGLKFQPELKFVMLVGSLTNKWHLNTAPRAGVIR